MLLQLLFALLLAAAARSLPSEPANTTMAPDECTPKPLAPGEKEEECCILPRGKPLSDDRKAIIKDCTDMYFNEIQDHLGSKVPPQPAGGQGPPKPHSHHLPSGLAECLEECVFNKSGHLTPELKLNKEKIAAFMIEEFGNDETWKPLIEEAVKVCAESTLTGNVKGDMKCKSGALEFKMCTIRHILKNCPSKFWKDSERCKAHKEMAMKCKDFVPPFPSLPPNEDSKEA